MNNVLYSGTFVKQDLGFKMCLQALETNESQHKVTHLTKEKTSLQELLKSEELIREKVMQDYLYLRHKVTFFNDRPVIKHEPGM